MIAATLNQNFTFVGMDSPTLVAYSNTVNFYNYDDPLHPHLSLTGDATVMR